MGIVRGLAVITTLLFFDVVLFWKRNPLNWAWTMLLYPIAYLVLLVAFDKPEFRQQMVQASVGSLDANDYFPKWARRMVMRMSGLEVA